VFYYCVDCANHACWELQRVRWRKKM